MNRSYIFGLLFFGVALSHFIDAFTLIIAPQYIFTGGNEVITGVIELTIALYFIIKGI